MAFFEKNKDMQCKCDMQIPKSEKKISWPPLPNPGDAPGTKYSLVKYKYKYKYFDISIHQVLKYSKY